MADPIMVDWGLLATEVLKTGLISFACSGAATFLGIRTLAKKQPAQPQPGRCSSHLYLEYGLLNLRNKVQWGNAALLRLCQESHVEIQAEPVEMPVPQPDKVVQ